MTVPLIQDTNTLTRLCNELRGSDWIALDTEFMRTRTYYAQLCLIQIATPERVACVDALALTNLDPLLEILYAPRTLKVIHAARQDLEVFADLRGAPPQPVFDTQIAAALCGYDDQIGYATLVETVTGHALPKLHTRADWTLRPLPAEQQRYAEDDVLYLREVYRFLAERLEILGRRDWLSEECAALTDPRLYRNDPHEAFRRLKQGQALPAAAQTILRALAAWRERTAQEKNLPRAWVVPDAALVELALTAPTTVEAVAGVSGMGGAATRKWSEAIVQAVRSGLAQEPRRQWDEPYRLERRHQALYERLQTHVCAVATQAKLSATLLAPRRELQRLVVGADSSVLHGWRRSLVGEELLRLCAQAQTSTTSGNER